MKCLPAACCSPTTTTPGRLSSSMCAIRLHPKTVTSFTDMDGYMHPHSYLRLPNGHVLATFQHSHHEMNAKSMGKSGGLVEIDDTGKVIRSSSSYDPTFPDAQLTPYGLVVLPDLDRVVSTDSSMHLEGIF